VQLRTPGGHTWQHPCDLSSACSSHKSARTAGVDLGIGQYERYHHHSIPEFRSNIEWHRERAWIRPNARSFAF